MATNGKQLVRVPKAAELIAARLRHSIVTGALKEGDPLPTEAGLVEEFGVSKPTLREAYRILESERLISVHRGAKGGPRVHTPSGVAAARFTGLVLQHRGTRLSELYEVSIMIEAPSARWAATRATRAELAGLRRLLEAAEGLVDDPPALLPVFHEFHKQVIALGRNKTIGLFSELLNSILHTVDRKYLAISCMSGEDTKNSRLAFRRHTQLLERLEAKDAQGAEDVWRTHLEEVAEFILHDLGADRLIETIDQL